MGRILDQHGRPLSSTKKPELREIATVSLQDRYSSYPSEGLTPYKLATIFKQADNGDIMRQSELFEEMESKDLHLFDCLQVRRKAVLGANATWETIAASDSPQDKKIAEFIEAQLDNIADLEDYFEDLLEGVGKGFRIQEIRWDISEGQAIIEKLKSIPNKRFTFFDSDLPKIITDKAPNGEDLVPYKFIYHKPSVRCGSQLKGGILRIAAWMYLFKNYSIKDWIAFAEIYGMPLRLGKYDPNATSDNEKRDLMQALRSLGSDAAGIISKNTEIEFVEAMKNAKGDIYETLSNFCNREMSKGILGQTLSIDTSGSTGTYSAAKAHELVRQDLREADAGSLASTIQSQLIVPLVGFNFGWDIALKSCPKFQINVFKPEDLHQTAETYDKLVNMGLEISQDHVYKKFGVAKPKEGDKLLQPPQYQQPTQIENKAQTLFPFKKENKKFTAEQEDVEQLINTATSQAQEIYQDYATTIKEVIVNAQSYEEIQEKLFELYDDLDSDDLEELTARTFFIADLYGRASVLNED